MRQTTLSVVLEVEPASVGRLSGIIEKLKRDEETRGPGVTELYGRLKWGVPTLHFISMSVFQAADYDPLFVIEANFDGRPGSVLGPDGGDARQLSSAPCCAAASARGS